MGRILRQAQEKKLRQDKMTVKATNLKALLTEPVNILLLVMVFLAVIGAWRYGKTVSGVDFYHFWVVGQALERSDTPDIYSEGSQANIGLQLLKEAYEKAVSERQLRAAAKRKVLDLTATPFLYAFFHAVITGNYEVDIEVFQVCSLVFSLLAVVGLCRLLRYSPIAIISAALLIVGWFQPFVSDIRVANVARLQLGMLVLFLWFQSRHTWRLHHFAGGLVLGLAVMFKPNLIFVAVMLVVSWLMNRRFRKLLFECFGILTAAAGAFTLSSVFFGTMRCWNGWIAALQRRLTDLYVLEEGNYAAAMLISNATGIRAFVCFAVLFVVLTTAFVWMARQSAKAARQVNKADQPGRDRAFFEDALMVSMGCLIYLLSAPLVWFHYFVLTLPMIFVAFRPFRNAGRIRTAELLIRRILAVVAVIGLTVDPVVAIFKITTHYSVAFVVCVSTFILFGLALWELLCLRIRPHPIAA